MLQENEIRRKQQHLGIQSLRACLCLLVIYNHVPPENNLHLANWLQQTFKLLCLMAVPCFVIMSFYLSAPLFLRTQPVTAKQLKKKLKRLLVPFIGWSIVGFVVYLQRLSLLNILLQLISGAVVNAPLYYLVLTIYFIVLFSLLTRLNIKIRFIILCLLIVFCFYVQHMEINYDGFSILPDSLQYTLGRFCELLPYAIVAIFLRKYFDLTKCYESDYRVDRRWFLAVVPAFVAGAILFIRFKPEGFGYQGIGLLLCALSTFLLFCVQSNKSLAGFVPNMVLSISNVSLGIFCSHYLLHRIIRSCFGSLKIYDIIVSIPFVYGLLLFLCSVVLCLKLKKSFNGRLKPFVL
jgi:hypothetical protein